MATLAQWFAGKEMPSHFYFTEPLFFDKDRWSNIPYEKLITLDEAMKFFDIEFDSGYGGQDVPNFTAWSTNYVYFVHEYDGSTRLRQVRRNYQ